MASRAFRTKPPRLLAATVLALLPVLVFYALLFAESRPVPMYDDYHAILAFALDLHGLHTPGAQLSFLAAAQHDEYKLVVEHLVVAADLLLTGRIHFGFLIFLANGMVLGLAALFWANSFTTSLDLADRLLLFAPALFLLFQLNYVENLDWAMCGLQTMPVILCSLATLHFATRVGARSTLGTSLCAIGAALSSANGFLVVPVALALLLSRRRYRAALLLLIGASVALAIFQYRRQPFDPSAGVASPPLTTRLLFFVSFLGGAVENMHHRPVPYAAVLLGSVLLLLLLVLLLHSPGQPPFLLGTAAWCLLTAAAVSQGRSYLGISMSLTGRYKIYSDLLLTACYLLVALHAVARRPALIFKRSFFAAALGLAVFFAAAADLNGYRFLVKRRTRTAFGLELYRADPQHTSPEVSLGGEPFGGYEPEISRQTLTSALETGLYRLPPAKKESTPALARPANPVR